MFRGTKPCKCAGDAVAEDDLLVQIETDKVTIDVRYQQKEPGVVKEFLVKMDDTVQVRLPMAWICSQVSSRPVAVLPYSWTPFCGFNCRSNIGVTDKSFANRFEA